LWAQKLIEGDLPTKKMRLLQAWISIHEEELMADWALAVKGEPVFKIDPSTTVPSQLFRFQSELMPCCTQQ